MTTNEREQVEAIKRDRAAIVDVLERIAFDNGADGRPLVLHLIAAVESK